MTQHCDPEEYDPWFIQQIKDIPKDDLIIIEPVRGPVICMSRSDLLHFYSVDSSWVWGDCDGSRAEIENYPDRVCKKFYKHPTTNQFIYAEMVKLIENNPKVKVWKVDTMDKVTLGRNIHFIGEVNLENELTFKLCPKDWDEKECEDAYMDMDVKLVPKILRPYITEEKWLGDTLSIMYKNIGDEGAKALAKWGGHTLDLSLNQIGDLGAKALAEWPGHTLELSGNQIGDPGAKNLAKWKGHTLNLGFNNIGDLGAKALAKWKGYTLKLGENHIGDLGAKHLAEWKGYILRLDDNHIGDLGAKHLAEWKGHTLGLSSNQIGDPGAKALAKWKGHTLNLSYNKIGPEGAKALAKWRGHTLDLCGNDIGPEAVIFLTENWEGNTLHLDRDE